jgi:hypothetical protein
LFLTPILPVWLRDGQEKMLALFWFLCWFSIPINAWIFLQAKLVFVGGQLLLEHLMALGRLHLWH